MRALKVLFRLLLGMQGVVVTGARWDEQAETVEILIRRRSNAKPRCPNCGKVMGGEIRAHDRKWRHLDIMRWRTILVADIREGCCPVHGRRVESVPWAESAANHTKEFDRQVASLAQVADKSAVARMFDVCWRTVGRMVKRVVDKHLPSNLLDDLTAIGVDETSYKRGHRYLTVVVCLTRGVVVWIGEGKSEETLNRFFDTLGPDRSKKIKVVTMDMSEAFKKSVEKNAPHAELVYDRFHVVKLLLEAVDEVRREECRELEGDAKKALKGTRYVFLKNPCRYNDKEKAAVEWIKRINRRLARVYELRIDFEEAWHTQTKMEAEAFLMKWTRSALMSRREPLMRFARTVRKHMTGITNYFKFARLSNAALEGTNNKIKLLIHRSYGFHSVSSLIAMIHLCCSGITLG
jgi:transposase